MVPKVTKWFPLENPPQRFFLEGLYDDHEGFRLLLKEIGPLSRVFRVSFDSYLSCRVIDEGFFLKKIPNFIQIQGPIYQIENSSYLAWFRGKKPSASDKERIKHVLIILEDDCIEVLCTSLPKVNKVKNHIFLTPSKNND